MAGPTIRTPVAAENVPASSTRAASTSIRPPVVATFVTESVAPGSRVATSPAKLAPARNTTRSTASTASVAPKAPEATINVCWPTAPVTTMAEIPESATRKALSNRGLEATSMSPAACRRYAVSSRADESTVIRRSEPTTWGLTASKTRGSSNSGAVAGMRMR